MPLDDETFPNDTRAAVVVRPSIAMELTWLTSSAFRPDWKADHPTIGALYSDRPDLEQRITQWWGEEPTSCGGFLELVYLADHGGILFGDDPDAFFERIEHCCSTVAHAGSDYGMQSEHDEDRAALLGRLRRLHQSEELRRAYVGLLRELWGAVDDDWRTQGRQAVAEGVFAKEEQLAKGAGWRQVTDQRCDYGGLTERLIDALGPEGEVVIVPTYFAHISLLADVPGMVLLSVKADVTGAAARARTEALARRLRAVADPTRLAILDSLRSGPKSVTELAARFSLSQPTVSNHVKLLRDTGIITDVRRGTRRDLMVRPQVLDELVQGLSHVLVAASAPPPDA